MDTKMRRSLIVGCSAAAALIVATAAIGAAGPGDTPDSFSDYVAKDGAISRPADYREKFEHIGSSAVASKPGGAIDEMHSVYSRPEDVKAFRRDGRFPDGAVLVKEVTKIASEKLTAGEAHWSAGPKLWFVLVKDAKGRFPGSDLWGDGWGWGLFLANAPAKNVATDYKVDCRTCHIPAKQNDWLYVRVYPGLRKGG
jgi:cytochrome c